MVLGTTARRRLTAGLTAAGLATAGAGISRSSRSLGE
jgi:hypothetical protein